MVFSSSLRDFKLCRDLALLSLECGGAGATHTTREIYLGSALRIRFKRQDQVFDGAIVTAIPTRLSAADTGPETLKSTRKVALSVRVGILRCVLGGLRLLLLSVALATVVGFVAPQLGARAAAPRSVVILKQVNDTVLKRLNRIRSVHGLVPLKESQALDASAAEHSRQMGTSGYFRHSSADGTEFTKRIETWYPARGFTYWSVGENLLWSSPSANAAHVVQMWMASPPHRENILNPEWRQIGIGAIHFRAAPGVYRDRAVTIVTADFGVRK